MHGNALHKIDRSPLRPCTMPPKTDASPMHPIRCPLKIAGSMGEDEVRGSPLMRYAALQKRTDPKLQSNKLKASCGNCMAGIPMYTWLEVPP